MKTFFVLFFSLLFSPNIFAQNWAICNGDKLKLQALRSLPKNSTLIQSYTINGKGGCRRNEATCLLSRDMDYVVRIASQDDGSYGIVVCLYDANRNEMITSDINNKLFNGWTFKCKQTGIYYLSFTFKDSQNYCGGAVLGFKR
jgi:hypothetical protein